MPTTAEDPLGPLRQVLAQPDQRTWRRFLPAARGAHRAVAARPDDRELDREPAAGTAGPAVRAWQVGAGVLILAAGIVLGTGLLPPEPPRRAPAVAVPFEPAAPEAPRPEAPAPTTAASPVRVWPAGRVEVAGRVLSTDGGRWEVGMDGDVVTVGDWDCDREATPAVLRPLDGRVAVFDRWAEAGSDEAARPVGTVPGATTLQAGSTCGALVVRSAAGTAQVLDTRRSDRSSR